MGAVYREPLPLCNLRACHIEAFYMHSVLWRLILAYIACSFVYTLLMFVLVGKGVVFWTIRRAWGSCPHHIASAWNLNKFHPYGVCKIFCTK